MTGTRLLLVCAVATLAAGSARADVGIIGDRYGAILATGDFNGDTYADLAVGAPTAEAGTIADSGAVHVIYGGPAGLQSALPVPQVFTQADLGMLTWAQIGARFGGALAAGDFNKDGYCDLAVGTPGNHLLPQSYAGVVNVLYGTPNGLVATGVIPGTQYHAQSFSQDQTGVETAESWDYFGQVLASGDFNGDTYADLAVGVPGEDEGTKEDAGIVILIFGSPNGLKGYVAGQPWDGFPSPARQTQSIFGIPWDVEAGDRFGASLAVGNFNGDAYDDLAVGAPGESYSGTDIPHAGRVSIFCGGPLGIGQTQSINLAFGEQDLPGGSLPGGDDRFGSALAAGDFDGDAHDDLAIGVPEDGFGRRGRVGSIYVVYGSTAGVDLARNQRFNQGLPASVAETAESQDGFGTAVAAGDLNGDGYADVAVGVPFESLDDNTILGAGFVNVLFGSSGTGLTAAENVGLSQDTPFVNGVAESYERFGAELVMGDFNHDGYADLVVGVPDEDVGTIVDDGIVNVLYGSEVGPSGVGDQTWGQSGQNPTP
jgi:hypothetical protein